MTWIPSQSYAMFRSWYCRNDKSTACDVGLDGFELWIIPRIFMCLASLVGIDATLWLLLRNLQYNNDTCSIFVDRFNSTKGVFPFLIVVATSWTTLLLGTRPFTNALETIHLSLLLALVFGYLKVRRPMKMLCYWRMILFFFLILLWLIRFKGFNTCITSTSTHSQELNILTHKSYNQP